MAIAESHTNSATIGTTEYSLPNNSTTLTPVTTDGIYQVFINVSTMTVTEQYRIRIYEKVTSGGSQVVIYDATLTGAMADSWVSPTLILLHGWDVTMAKITGTDRSMAWSIRQVA